MNAPPNIKMNATQFFSWCQTQQDGRFELVGGMVTMMPAETVLHVKVKYALARAMEDAIAVAGLNFVFYGDGTSVRISEEFVRGPDGCVAEGPEAEDLSLEIGRPIIVIEVVSPSSERNDIHAKLVDYFSLQSVMHYIVADPWKGVVLHHKRQDENHIATEILRSGEIDFSPPGFRVPVKAFLGKR